MTPDRRAMRQPFLDAWQKFQQHLPLTPIELAVSDIIREHPEYHALFADPERALSQDWPPEHGETNPFLHLGLHLSIREMAQIDQPHGFKAAYLQRCERHGDRLAAEHAMMDCLAESLWQAQRRGAEPDGAALLDCLNNF
ncbi:DUF1841 family protein [Halothiobacillus sp. DCM-1]|uniref:DUF1841 family protein n=1 Tax=Halothiobacillus sp. DCM-1 TaxID=3112558 RepID=UPI00324F66B3